MPVYVELIFASCILVVKGELIGWRPGNTSNPKARVCRNMIHIMPTDYRLKLLDL